MTKDSEPFLDRWSRRKRGAGKASKPRGDRKPVDQAPSLPVEEAPEGGSPEANERAVAELPDIDSLDKDSDYTGFLREGVPEHLKKAALRRLWRSDPVLANLDGLNDYDEDYSLIFTKAVTESVKTAYRVGKGMIGSDDVESDSVGESGTVDAEPEVDSGAPKETAESKGQSREGDAAKPAAEEQNSSPKIGTKRSA